MSGQGAGVDTLRTTIRDVAGEQACANAPTKLSPGTGLEPFKSAFVPPGPPIIEVTDLHTSYDGKPTLRGVNLAVYPGETMVIMGGSGCGKSTLLKHLIGRRPPTRGTSSCSAEPRRAESAGTERGPQEVRHPVPVRRALQLDERLRNVALPLREHADLPRTSSRRREDQDRLGRTERARRQDARRNSPAA